MRVIRFDRRGSMTVEAAVVVTTLIFVLSAVILAVMLMYQKVLLTKAASLAAQQGTEIWIDSRKSIQDGSWDDGQKRDPLYAPILNDAIFVGRTFPEVFIDVEGETVSGIHNTAERKGDLLEAKYQKISELLHTELSKSIIKPYSTSYIVNYRNILVQREVEVTIKQELRLPLVPLTALFGGRRTIELKGSGTAVVAEPAEYIRSIDLILEYANRAGQSFDIGGKIDELKEKLTDK